MNRINIKWWCLCIVMPVALCLIVDNAFAAGDTDGTRDFAGLKFGVGLSLTIDTGEHSRIDEAKLVNNRVRVTEESNDIPRIMLESHYFFKPDFKFLKAVDSGSWGHGPFVAIQPGTEDIIEAISLGWMVGLKRKDDDTDTSSWNIGVGAVVDPNAKILGDGVEENQPLPAGETEIRYKETSQWGVLILTSFSF